MTGFLKIVGLELLSFVRSKTLAMLVVASGLWMFLLPRLVRGDGTPEGLRELDVRYSLGGVFVLLAVSLLASATGSIARERAARRLQLTLVRPVRYATVVLAKGVAHMVVGAAVLALASVILLFRSDAGRPCAHVLKPILPSPREEAKVMYEAYMASPDTPPEVRRAKKSVVLRLLENRAVDHYQTIATNAAVVWQFPGLDLTGGGRWPACSVRLRFTNQFDTRDCVQGVFSLDGRDTAVSNITQAVLTVPLSVGASGGKADGERRLSFRNEGLNPLMLRPRKDLDLLVPADTFGWNLVRAYLTLVAVLAILVAFGLLLSASLGRPVALFVALVTLIVSEMSPSVIEQYPDELETKLSDRIGLVFTRFAADVTRPVSSLNPLERLAADECVERETVVRALALDLILLPFVLALLSGVVLPRKAED